MLYRLYTELKNEELIEKVVSKFYPGFTVIKGEGFWRLQKEHSLIIEIVTEDEDAKIEAVAKEIKAVNSQDNVLIQKIKNKQWLV